MSYLHEWHMQGSIFWVPAPWGPGEGQKMSNFIKSQLLSQFQRFSIQTLCVFSQNKDMKHIRWDFHSTAWVMPHGWDCGRLGGDFFSEIQQELVCELLT